MVACIATEYYLKMAWFFNMQDIQNDETLKEEDEHDSSNSEEEEQISAKFTKS